MQNIPFTTHKTIFRYQGACSSDTVVTRTTELFGIKNADAFQVKLTAFNMTFSVKLRFCTAEGVRFYDAAGAPIPDIELFPETVVGTTERKAFTLKYPETEAMADYRDFAQLIVSYKASSAYTAPPPVRVGVPNLHNHGMLPRDERAPLLDIQAKLINPKP